MNTTPDDTPWTGVDLRCAMAALGLSANSLADLIVNPTTGGAWRQGRVSEAMRGERTIPAWLVPQLKALETARDDLAARMVDSHQHGDPILAHRTGPAMWRAHPATDGLPPVVSHVAAGLAAADIEAATGARPPIEWAD